MGFGKILTTNCKTRKRNEQPRLLYVTTSILRIQQTPENTTKGFNNEVDSKMVVPRGPCGSRSQNAVIAMRELVQCSFSTGQLITSQRLSHRPKKFVRYLNFFRIGLGSVTTLPSYIAKVAKEVPQKKELLHLHPNTNHLWPKALGLRESVLCTQICRDAQLLSNFLKPASSDEFTTRYQTNRAAHADAKIRRFSEAYPLWNRI